MKCFSLLLCVALTGIQNSPVQTHTTALTPKLWSLGDTVNGLPTVADGSVAFDVLLRVGTNNHLPLGLLSQPKDGPSLCRTNLVFSAPTLPLGDVLREINSAVPDFEASLEDGTLDVLPRSPAKGARDLITLRLDQFRSGPKTRYMVAVTLWFWIRAQLDPDLGSAFMGGTPTSTPIEKLNLTNVSVKTALNTIARSGTGGVWYLDSQNLKELHPEMTQPFVAYGYDGDQSEIESIHACNTHESAGRGAHIWVPHLRDGFIVAKLGSARAGRSRTVHNGTLSSREQQRFPLW